MAVGLMAVSLYSAVGNRFPRMTLVDICRSLLGRWVGTIAGIYFISFYFIDSGIVLWQLGDFMVTHIMLETPIQSFLILFLLAVVVGARLGIGTIVRAAETIFPWVLLLFVSLVLFLTPQIDFRNLQPVLKNGWNPVLRGSLELMGYYFESFIFLMLLPYAAGKGSGNALRTGMLIGSAILFMTITFCILVLGPGLSAINIFTSYVLAKKISIGHFLERIEVFMASIWFFTLFFKLLVCFYSAVLGTAQLLKMKNLQPLTLPIAVLVLVGSLVFIPNVAYFNVIILRTWWTYTMFTGLLLPLLLLGISLFSAQKKKNPLS